MTGKRVFAAALGASDKSLGDAVDKERSWRYGYVKHIVKHVQKSAASREEALKVCLYTCVYIYVCICTPLMHGILQIANAGLDYLHNNFEFIRNGESMTMQQAMDVCRFLQ